MASTPPHSHFDNEKDLGPDDSISAVSTSTTVSGSQSRTMNIKTPPSSSAPTSTPNGSSNIPYITRNSAPGPGSTYIIVSNSGSENQALTVVEGQLRLVTPPELLLDPPVLDAVQAKTFAGICNWHWHCEQSDGWLGFRNAATGLWLGSSCICVNEDKINEAVLPLEMTGSNIKDLGVNEQFCVRRAVDNKGYVLLKRVDLKQGLFSAKTVSVRPVMGLEVISPKTSNVDKRRMTWEFVKVDRP